jgi:hypothetical protein
MTLYETQGEGASARWHIYRHIFLYATQKGRSPVGPRPDAGTLFPRFLAT